MVWVILFAAAITIVWVEGSIFAPLRTRGPQLWRNLAGCGLCSGVWIGCGLALLAGERVWWQVLGMGSLSAVAALTWSLWTDQLVANKAVADKLGEEVGKAKAPPMPQGRPGREVFTLGIVPEVPSGQVTKEGLVQVPVDIREQLGLQRGGGVVFVLGKHGRVEMLTNQQFADLFEGEPTPRGAQTFTLGRPPPVGPVGRGRPRS